MNESGRYAAWVGVAGWSLAALSFSYAWVLRVSPSVMIEPLMAEFGVGGALLGVLSSLYFYTYALIQAPAGHVMDRWGPRRALALAALVAGAGSILFGWAPGIEIAYLGRLLIGAGVAFGFLGSMVLASAWFPPRRFAFFSGLGMGIGLLGGIAGQAPLAILVESMGWRETMFALGAAAVILAAAIWLVVRDRPGPAARPGAPAKPAAVTGGLWAVVRHKPTLLIAAAAGLMTAPMLAFGALWGVPYTMLAYGLDKTAAASALAPILFGFTVGGAAWGWLSDRIGRRRQPLLVGALIAFAALAAALYAPGLPLAAYSVLLFLMGLGCAAMSVTYAWTREHNAGAGTGAALGFVNMVSVLGGALFQPLIGFLLDLQWAGALARGARVYALEDYRAAFLILPALYLVALLCAASVRESWCRPVAPTTETAPAR